MWLLILLSLLARLWRFGQVPISLYWDEVAIGLDARSLLQTGKDLSGQSWLQPLFYSYGDYKAPVYIWLTTLLGKISSVSELTIRLPSLLASLLTAFTLFQLVKLVSPKKSKLALYTLASFLIMPWSIHFSRIGFESHLSVFWLILSIFFLIKAAKKNKPLNIILAALAASLGIYSYISLRLLAPFFFITVFFIYHRSKLKARLAYFLAGLFIITASVFILMRSPGYSASQQYRLSNDNLITSTSYIDKSAAALAGQETSLLARVIHHRYLYKAQEYLNNYAAHFNPKFLIFSGDPNLRHHSGFGGELLFIQGIFLAIGLLALVSYSKKEAWLLLTWLLLSPAVAALVNETPHASRSIYLIIPLAWLIGLGLDWTFKQTRSRCKTILPVIVTFTLSLNLLFYLHDYFSHYPQRSSLAWLNPYKQAALYFKDNPTDQPVYITDQWYQPRLYFAYYADLGTDQVNFSLPAACPPEAWCVAPLDWQSETTDIINQIPGTDKLVIKTAKYEE